MSTFLQTIMNIKNKFYKINTESLLFTKLRVYLIYIIHIIIIIQTKTIFIKFDI